MSAKTVTIQIGNSDNKLTQEEWSWFCRDVNERCLSRTPSMHFSGHSLPNAPWQNACWVVVIDAQPLAYLSQDLAELAAKYRQDAIAVTVGETEMVGPR